MIIDKIIMELQTPLNIKRVSSVLLAISSLESEDNKMSPMATHRSTKLQSPYTSNMYLTNSTGYKPQHQLVYPPETKIRILNEGWIVVGGTVRVVSKQDKVFQAAEGFIWFLSPQLKQQIKEVETVGTVALKRLNMNVALVENLEGYYKQVREILLRSPYFSWWNLRSIMDIACVSSSVRLESNKKVVDGGEEPDFLYILKSGEVELIRNCTLTNRLFQSYEMELEQVMRTESEVRFKVEAGNCFGLDGIFIKQGSRRIYTVVTKTPCQLSRIPAGLLNLAHHLFDPKAEDKILKKSKEYMGDGNNPLRYRSEAGIINRESLKKRQFVKMINQYENKVRMKSVAHRIPRADKSLKIQKPKNPLLSVQEHREFYRRHSRGKNLTTNSLVPDIKNTKVYIGLLKEKINQKQCLKEHQNYKKKVEQAILEASRMKRQSKSTECFRIKAYSLEKRQRDINPE